MIWRVREDGVHLSRVANTGGRPLGLEWLPDGRILVCDARRGLLAVAPDSGAVETLTDLVHGRRMAFCNNAAVAADGTIWFSDSSRHHGIERWKADIVENTASGRLLAPRPGRDGRRGRRRAEFRQRRRAGRRRVLRRRGGDGRADRRTALAQRAAGRRAPTCLAEDLPGYPDNIARGQRRTGLGDRRLAQGPGRRGADERPDGPAPGGLATAGAAAAEAEAHRPA